MSTICSVCSLQSFVERAHVRSRNSSEEEDKKFNLLDLCPTCHTFFDLHLITMHPIWRCWVFSDKYNKKTSYGSNYNNPFVNIKYSYPPERVVKKVSNILHEHIIWNNENEFEVRGNISANMYFKTLEKKLKYDHKWDYSTNKHKHQIITMEYNLSPNK